MRQGFLNLALVIGFLGVLSACDTAQVKPVAPDGAHRTPVNRVEAGYP